MRLAPFSKSDDGKNLLAGYRRAANILRAGGEKGRPLKLKAILSLSGRKNPSMVLLPEEKALGRGASARGRAGVPAWASAANIRRRHAVRCRVCARRWINSSTR